MNIAVLGSSFDPAHNGHLTIANNILRSKKINKVILMPVNIHPFAKKLTPVIHRLAMAKFLGEKLRTSSVQGKGIEVSDLELKKGSTSYSIDTLKVLRQNFPKDKLYWIIGSDYLGTFTKWKGWQKIIQDFGLIIVARDINTDIEKGVKKFINDKNLEKKIIILNAKDFPPFDISSSEIKKRIKEGRSIKNLVPENVGNYIIRNKLYL